MDSIAMDPIAMDSAIASAARIEKRCGRARRPTRIGRRAGGPGFLGISALLFAAAASCAILWDTSMSDMGEMPMPGGWTMSMLWMRMPGQTWPGVGAAFLGMWTAMMIAMMLPSLVPALWRYIAGAGSADEAARTCAFEARGGMRSERLAALIGAGYFFVWIVLGAAVFVLGIVLAALEMQAPELARAAPIAAGAVVFAAGVLQFTPWKAHHLALCREIPCSLESDAVQAWRCGVRLGLHCCQCTAGSTAVLLVLGMMNLRTMAAVTAAITVERLATAGQRVSWTIGAVTIGAGLFLIISAA